MLTVSLGIINVGRSLMYIQTAKLNNGDRFNGFRVISKGKINWFGAVDAFKCRLYAEVVGNWWLF